MNLRLIVLKVGIVVYLLNSCNSINCEQILIEEPCLAKRGMACNEQEIQQDFEILRVCSGLTVQDEIFLKKETMGVIMIQLLNERKEPSYRNILASINEMKESIVYENIAAIPEVENVTFTTILVIENYNSTKTNVVIGSFQWGYSDFGKVKTGAAKDEIQFSSGIPASALKILKKEYESYKILGY